MKMLVTGDFHGTFPKKFEKIIKKEKIDVFVSNGDYLPFAYRKLWFKHCFEQEVDLWEVVGKKKYKALVEKDIAAGERVLKRLDKLKVPVITTLGNIDWPLFDDGRDNMGSGRSKKNFNWEKDKKDYFAKLIKKYKNIHRIDYKAAIVGDYVIIGARGHSNKGSVKSKAYKKHKAILEKLFSKFRKKNKEKKVIFLTHNMLYNTKLDKLSKKAHPLVAGKHLGSKMFRRIVDKWQPVIHTGGHIHEARGTQKVGKTLSVNPGSAHEGMAMIVDINDKNGRVNVKRIG